MAQNTAAMQQENFLVQAEGNRKTIIRQDRILLEPKKCYIEIHQNRYEVLNVSSFGLAITLNGEQLQQMLASKKTEFFEIPLVYLATQIQLLSLRLARSMKIVESHQDDHILGFEVIGEPLTVDTVNALEKTTDAIASQSEYFTKLATVPLEFKTLVFEMKDWLEKLKVKIEDLEKSGPTDNAEDLNLYKRVIADSMGDYLGKVIPSRYLHFPNMIAKLSAEQKETCVAFIREQIGNLIYGAPFAGRAYGKPRGYAGDFEMMNHLYRNELVGATLYDQCMHKYFIDEPAGQAVKNRGYYLLEKIKNTILTSKSEVVRILSVASGPAMEIQLLLKEFPKTEKTVEFTCLDQDSESLKHAQRQLQTIDRFANTGAIFKFTNLAIKNIIGRGLPSSGFDLIYSAGLFDYFTDPVARAAAAKMAQGLNQDGKLVIGNFSKSNPCVPFMEMVLDWHLIYRSHEDMERVFTKLCPSLRIEQEPLGVNLFAVMGN